MPLLLCTVLQDCSTPQVQDVLHNLREGAQRQAGNP
jgi:hypothetical protein